MLQLMGVPPPATTTPTLPALHPPPPFLFVFPVELARLLWQIYNSGVKVFRQQQINLTPPAPPLPASPSPDKKTLTQNSRPALPPTASTPPTTSPHILSCVICPFFLPPLLFFLFFFYRKKAAHLCAWTCVCEGAWLHLLKKRSVQIL